MEGVKRGFENALVQESTVQVSRVAGLLPIKHPCQLPEPLYTPFSNSYMSEITRRAGRAKLFTTTHQGFNPDLGRIAELVPNVRIVFIERDVDDTAFRIFCKDYPQEVNPFAYHVPSIYEFIGEYAQLVEAWSGHLSDISIRCTYEDMVGDPKNTLKRVADFCGLTAPKGKLPDLGDDRGCSAPYRTHLSEARK